jgi:hypothetical protein
VNGQGPGSVEVWHTKRSADPWRKLLWAALAAAVILRIYFIQELLAALIIFSVLFLVAAAVAGFVYLAGRAGETTISMAEPVARRGIIYAEELSRKAFRRPHSAPAP